MTAPSRDAGRALDPTATAAAMFIRELMRRWPTVIFMVFMPLSYFLISYATNDATATIPTQIWSDGDYVTVPVLDRDFKALYLAVLGISVTSSFAALTTVLGSSAAIRRLRLAGFKSAPLLTARMLVLGLITLVSTLVFLVVLVPLVPVQSLLLTAASLLLVGLLGVGLGTLVGLVIPREFEAAMLIIAIAGIQMALGRGGSGAERFLVYWPAVESLKTAAFAPVSGAGPHLGLAVFYVADLFMLSAALWSLRTRIYHGRSVRAHHLSGRHSVQPLARRQA